MRLPAFLQHRPAQPSHARAAPSSVRPTRDAALWKCLFDATDDAVLLVDRNGNIRLSNPAANDLFAEPDPAAHSLLTHTLSSDLDKIFQACVRTGAPQDSDVVVSQPVSRNLHVRVLPAEHDDFLVVLRDLTELRRLERVRQDFVANVSHELRTPLTSIKAMAETLQDGARTDEDVADRFLETIIHESDRLVRLSSDLLDLARVETRGPNKTWIDLSKLIRDITERFTGPAAAAGVSLVNHVSDVLHLMADSDEMAQVFVNLLDNAISYTPRDGTVTVNAFQSASSITIEFTDTGIGILSHDIPRLFERFYRADKARSRASGGTGLGLSIVKHIVETHGGTVSVESEYNKGSVFRICLPR